MEFSLFDLAALYGLRYHEAKILDCIANRDVKQARTCLSKLKEFLTIGRTVPGTPGCTLHLKLFPCATHNFDLDIPDLYALDRYVKANQLTELERDIHVVLLTYRNVSDLDLLEGMLNKLALSYS